MSPSRTARIAGAFLALGAAAGCHKAPDDPSAVTAAEERQLNASADQLDANAADATPPANDTDQTS